MTRRGLVRALLCIGSSMGVCRGTGARPDDDLIALVKDLRETRRAIDAVLDGDDRDACDIPGYIATADRHLALVDAVCGMAANSSDGILAKANAIEPRDAAIRTESAIAIALSLAADLRARTRAGLSVDGRPSLRVEHGRTAAAEDEAQRV